MTPQTDASAVVAKLGAGGERSCTLCAGPTWFAGALSLRARRGFSVTVIGGPGRGVQPARRRRHTRGVHGAAAAPYPADLAVVIDAGCRSSCETLALLLHQAGGRLIGERTGGASGAPVTVVLPRSQATVTIPARAMYDPHGDPIEGHGVTPDDEVTDDRAAIATGRDRALEAAIAWACQRQPAPCP